MSNTVLSDLHQATLAHIAALEADKRTDYVLVWDYGLGVKFDGKRVIAVRLHEASPIRMKDVQYKVVNSSGVNARYVRRDTAIEAHLPSLREQAVALEAAIREADASLKFAQLREALA